MTQPNVVIVLVDELRSFEVGCYGNDVIRTPHMDALAGEGAMFATAVTNNPVCSPARACVLSGQYGRTTTGSLTNDCMDPCADERNHFPNETLPEILKAHGYHTAIIGKWHLDPPPATMGFDESCFPLNVHRHYGQTYIDNGQWTEPVEQFGPDYELDKVETFLDDHAADDEPFFLYYNISPPHEPIGPAELPNAYRDMYDPADVLIRPNAYVNGELAYDWDWFKMYLIWGYWWRIAKTGLWDAGPRCGYPGQVGNLPEDDAMCPADYSLRDLTAAYYAATTCCDDLLGRFMTMLADKGLDDNTIIVFASDHGDNLGSHGLFNKDCLYEEAIRIPMMFHRLGQIAPIRNDRQIAGLIDIAPTLLDLLGLDVPDHMVGRSLTPTFAAADATLEDNTAFIECNAGILGRCTVGVRTETHTYGRWLEEDHKTLADAWGFFDLRTDPDQQRNLLETGEQAELAAELHARVAAQHEAISWLGD